MDPTMEGVILLAFYCVAWSSEPPVTHRTVNQDVLAVPSVYAHPLPAWQC